MIPENIIMATARLLQQSTKVVEKIIVPGDVERSVDKLTPDGSMRNFFRVRIGETFTCVGVFPPENDAAGFPEAQSAYNIGRHLYHSSVPVPEIIGWDDETALILFEDCGDTRLHDLVTMKSAGLSGGAISDKVCDLYRQLVVQLCRMQIKGANQFDVKWCYDTPYYDENIMVKKEALYFYRAFWLDLLGGFSVDGVEEEFEDLAKNGARGPSAFFLHRDFQCRNIMVKGGQVKIIDFQGGRLGPLGYDLASLLLDPYSSLPEIFKEELKQTYISELKSHVDFHEKDFASQYTYLELFRNLQIIGAFSFLYKRKGKAFFKEFIIPSLQELGKKMSNSELNQYTALRRIVTASEKSVRSVL